MDTASNHLPAHCEVRVSLIVPDFTHSTSDPGYRKLLMARTITGSELASGLVEQGETFDTAGVRIGREVLGAPLTAAEAVAVVPGPGIFHVFVVAEVESGSGWESDGVTSVWRDEMDMAWELGETDEGFVVDDVISMLDVGGLSGLKPRMMAWSG